MSKLWSEDNPDSYFPVLRGYTALNGGGCLNSPNDKYIQNIGYLRLKNLVIGYTLPKEWIQKAYIQNLRVYVSGENLILQRMFLKEDNYARYCQLSAVPDRCNLFRTESK